MLKAYLYESQQYGNPKDKVSPCRVGTTFVENNRSILKNMSFWDPDMYRVKPNSKTKRQCVSRYFGSEKARLL